MSDARDLARWIEEARFTPTRDTAYDMGDVDRFLDELVAVVRRGEPITEVIAAKQLRTVGRLREGYGQAEVDSFLAQLATGGGASGASGAPPASGSDDPLVRRIEDVRFSPVRMRSGYDMGDVDELLDHLARAIERHEGLRPLIEGSRLRTVRFRESYDCDEVDGFLAGLVAEHG